MNGAASSWLRWAGAALLVFAGPSMATNTQTPMTLAQISARAVEAKYGRADAGWRDLTRMISQGWASGATPTGAVVVAGALKGPSPIVGEVIDVTVRRAVPWSSVAKAAAKALPLIGTAVAIAEIAQAIRCREKAGGGSECDPGQGEVSQQVTRYRFEATFQPSFTSGYVYASEQAACEATAAYKNSTVTGQTWSVYAINPGTCYIRGLNDGGGYVGQQASSLSSSVVNDLACPEVVVNGVHLVPVKGPDGKCMTNLYQPATDEQVATKMEAYGDKSKAPQIAGELSAAGKPMDHPIPVAQPDLTSIWGGRETTTHPDGSTTVRDTRYDMAPTANGYGWTPTIFTKDYAPGATIPPPGEVTGGTSQTGGAAPEQDIITCGLPNTPACKIDETGTPEAAADDSAQRAEGFIAGIKQCVLTPSSCVPALPNLNWSFALPSSCSPIPLAGFGQVLTQIDMCTYQPMIHDLVSMLWAGGGLFGAIRLMFRGS